MAYSVLARVLAVQISAVKLPVRNWRRSWEMLLRRCSVKASCGPRMLPSPLGLVTLRPGISWVENASAWPLPSTISTAMPPARASTSWVRVVMGVCSVGRQLCSARYCTSCGPALQPGTP